MLAGYIDRLSVLKQYLLILWQGGRSVLTDFPIMFHKAAPQSVYRLVTHYPMPWCLGCAKLGRISNIALFCNGMAFERLSFMNFFLAI